MLHLKIALRNLFKLRLNNSVIVISLAVGIASISLISIFLKKELKTDNFHPDGDRIYALISDAWYIKGKKTYQCYTGPIDYITENFTQVEERCLRWYSYAKKAKIDEKTFINDFEIISASDNFFSFFGYELIQGNAESVLENSDNIVISDEFALKYFGTINVVNKSITLETNNSEKEMNISGVFKVPDEISHLKFDIVQLLEPAKYNRDVYCYFKLKPNSSPNDFKTALDENQSIIPQSYNHSIFYYPVALRDIHFDPDFYGSRDKKDMWIAFVIGLLILVIATFNYLGIINNKLINKIKDYEIKRINGSSKLRFVLNFMIENVILIIFSFGLSWLLLTWSLPFFNEITKSFLTVNYFSQLNQILIQLSIVFLLILITFLFTFYKINVKKNLSLLQPVGTSGKKTFQIPSFSIFQLACTIVLIVCSVTIFKQIKYISSTPPGFDKDVISIDLPIERRGMEDVFKEELLKNSSIENVSIGMSPLIQAITRVQYNFEGESGDISYRVFPADKDFVETAGLKVIEGQNLIEFDDRKDVCLVNKAFTKRFSGIDLIGKKLPGNETFTIVGIVEDFHYSDLKTWIEPAYIYSGDSRPLGVMIIKSNEKNYASQVKTITNIWKKLEPEYEIGIKSLGDEYEKMHSDNKNFIKLISSCCIISVFLSMIGLFAISVQNSQRRTKEIGVRKVNGAKILEVVSLLNKDFVIWVIVAFAISAPIAFYAMDSWLKNFVYKTELSWWIFALGGSVALCIALITVSWQSWMAARRNPVEALRYE